MGVRWGGEDVGVRWGGEDVGVGWGRRNEAGRLADWGSGDANVTPCWCSAPSAAPLMAAAAAAAFRPSELRQFRRRAAPAIPPAAVGSLRACREQGREQA